MPFPLLDNLVEEVQRFAELPVLETTAYEQLNAHIRTAYRRSSRKPATCMQERNVDGTSTKRGAAENVY